VLRDDGAFGVANGGCEALLFDEWGGLYYFILRFCSQSSKFIVHSARLELAHFKWAENDSDQIEVSKN